MSKELDSIFSRVEEIREQWNQLYQQLQELVGTDGHKLNTELPLPGVPLTTAEVRTRVLQMFDLLLGIKDKIADVLLPAPMVGELQGSVDQLSATIQELSKQIASVEANAGVGTINPENLVVTSRNNAITFNFGKFMRNVSAQLDAVLVQYYRIAPTLIPQSALVPSSTVSEAVRLLNGAQRLAIEIQQIKDHMEEDQALATRHRTDAEAAKTETERLRGESEQSRRSIGEYEADATQKIAQVRATVGEAERLAGQVKAYQPDFDRFQAELTEREEWFAKARQDEEQLIAGLTAKEQQIAQINQSAEAMLKGATVSGLASSFGEIRDKITKELDWARRGFYFAVALLFLSVLPLAVYIIPGLSLFGLLRGTSSAGDFELGQVLIRALLLVPFAWLAKFAAARHATLFRLREHYAYKYSIASSVEGFKKQAPSLQDEIAAAAFKELTFNPADRMDPKSADSAHPNPVVDWIMRRLGATHDGKQQ